MPEEPAVLDGAEGGRHDDLTLGAASVRLSDIALEQATVTNALGQPDPG
jgi:hypothetical protein